MFIYIGYVYLCNFVCHDLNNNLYILGNLRNIFNGKKEQTIIIYFVKTVSISI